MQVTIVFAALFAVASAGVLTGPTLLSAPVAYHSAPVAIAHGPVLRSSPILINQAPVLRSSPILINQAPVLRSSPILVNQAPLAIAHPALTRTVIAGPGLAVAHAAPIGLVQPTIIG